jgi:hypothetical protein
MMQKKLTAEGPDKCNLIFAAWQRLEVPISNNKAR